MGKKIGGVKILILIQFNLSTSVAQRRSDFHYLSCFPVTVTADFVIEVDELDDMLPSSSSSTSMTSMT